MYKVYGGRSHANETEMRKTRPESEMSGQVAVCMRMGATESESELLTGQQYTTKKKKHNKK